MINPITLVSAVTISAVILSEGRTSDEISQLGVIFTQLGDTLATIAFQQQLIQEQQENENQSNDEKYDSKEWWNHT